MTEKEKLYADWVERAWSYSVEVGKKAGYPLGCVQNYPCEADGKTPKNFDIAILGIAPHESGWRFDLEKQHKTRFYGNNDPRNWPNPWPRTIADIDKTFGKVEDIYFSNILFWGEDHDKIKAQYKEKCYELTAELMDKVLRPRIVICSSIDYVFKPLQRALGNRHWENIKNRILRPTGDVIYNNVTKCVVNGVTYYGIPHLTGNRWRGNDREIILDYMSKDSK